MTVTTKIKCDDATFHPTPEYELARILHRLADRLVDNKCLLNTSPSPIFSTDGNNVGRVAAAKTRKRKLSRC